MRGDRSLGRVAHAALAVALCASTLVLMPQPALAATEINNLPRTSDASPFGDTTDNYFGQTFIAPGGGVVLTEVTVDVGAHTSGADVGFRLLVTEVTDVGGEINPTNVLFESGDLKIASGTSAQLIVVPVPSLALTAGTTYAYILDAFVLADGVNSVSDFGIRTGYADGILFFLGPSAGSRTADFASNWTEVPALDLAFKLVFGDPPPPTSSCAVLQPTGVVASPSTGSGTNGLIAAESGGAIVSIDPSSGAHSALVGSAGDSKPQVAPNGSRVAFINGGNVWVADFPSGANRTQVTTAGGFNAPAWSPSSSTLVFESASGLSTANATANAPVSALTGTGAGDTDGDYSPDGQYVVFDSGTGGGISRVAANGAAGRTTLAGTCPGDDNPHVAVGGGAVYFATGGGIASLSWPNGGSRSALAGTKAGDVEPFVSPDGTKVGFTGGSLSTVNSSGVGGRAAVAGTVTGDRSGSWATAGGTTPPQVPPTSTGQIQFTAASACGSPAMLALLPPGSVTVAATNSIPGHGVSLAVSGLPSYLTFDPATGRLAVSGDPLQLLPALLAAAGTGLSTVLAMAQGIPVIGPLLAQLLGPVVALLTPPTVTITATDTVSPGAAPATCGKLIRVSLF